MLIVGTSIFCLFNTASPVGQKSLSSRANTETKIFTVCPNLNQFERKEAVIVPTDFRNQEDTVNYDGSNHTGIGLSNGGTFYAAVRFTPTVTCTLKSVIFFLYQQVSADGFVYIHETGTVSTPGPKIDSASYAGITGTWNRVNFPTPIVRNADIDFWLSVKISNDTGRYPIGADAGPSVIPLRSFLSMDGSVWQSLPSVNLNYNLNIRAIGRFQRFNNDVGVTEILSPGNIHPLYVTMTPQAKVKNYGTFAQHNFPVVCSIVGANGSLRFANSQIISLEAGRDTTVSFPTWAPTISETCTVKMCTRLATDENPDNDGKTRVTLIGTVYAENFEANNGGYLANPSTGAWAWGVPTSGPGNAHSGLQLWATVLNGDYANNANWKLTSISFIACTNNPMLKFWHWYNMESGWDGGNVKISTDNGTSWTVISPVGGYPERAPIDNVGIPRESCYAGVHATWAEAVFNLPVISGQTFLIRWHFGSDATNTYPGWYIDDVTGEGFVAQPSVINDVGVDAIIYPTAMHRINAPMQPIARVKNFGPSAQTNFPVVCSIIGESGAVRYTNTQMVASLAAGDTIRIYFASWTPTIAELCTVKIRTTLSGDQNQLNDLKTIITQIGLQYLSENFNGATFPPSGWTIYNFDGGTQQWVRYTDFYYSAPACAACRYENSTLNNNDWLITPRIGPVGLNDSLIFYYRAGQTNYYDTLFIRVSTYPNINDTTRYIITNLIATNSTNWTRKALGISAFSSSPVYIAFQYSCHNRFRIAIDDVTVTGFTLGIAEDNQNNFNLLTMLNPLKPNPTSKFVNISFSLSATQKVTLKIYDRSGRIVKTLVNGQVERGVYNQVWDGRDDNNRSVAEGIYFYTLETPKQNFTKKMILTR
jgi:hypothetical protein